MTMTTKADGQSPSLVIQRIRVTSDRGVALELDLKRGLNVIRGENSSGRTTLLKLFEFGLGADVVVARFFVPEVQECKRLLMQVELNGTSYTIERKFGRGSRHVMVYQGDMDVLLHDQPSYFAVGEEFSDFLLHRLGIPRVSYLNSYYDRERKITFNDLYDALYIDQERGFSQVHARIRGEAKRKHVFKLLTRMRHPDLYQVEIEEQSLKKQRADLQADFQAVSRFFGSVELPTPVEIQSRIDRLSEQRAETGSQLQNLRLRLRSSPAYANPLREKILDLETLVAEKQRDLSFAKQTLESYVELENQLYEDLDRIARIRVSAAQLASFEFERCPRCLQGITIEMKRLETEGNCSVCGRPLVQDSDAIEELKDYEAQIRFQLEELQELQGYYQDSIKETSGELSTLQIQLDSRRQALDDALREFVSPLIQEIESLGYKTASIDEEINRLQELRRWRERLQEMQDELDRLSSKILETQAQKEELLEQEKRMRTALAGFEDYFYRFVSSTYPGFLDAKIDDTTFLPIVNNYDYTAKSATQRDIAILGYCYALLRFSLENSSYIPRHLVIDTPRQDDLAENLYRAVLKEYKELEDIYNGDFQLILVVREPVEFLRDDEILQLVDGQRLLRV
jgi:predicted  nucleic acid-binding Zn-ribbon protein